MKKRTLKYQLDAKGFSLIEVIASILILAIILISFFPLLITSNKTTKVSETIVDSTYVTQKEMERLYNIARDTTFSNRKDKIEEKLAYECKDAGGNIFCERTLTPQEISLNNPMFEVTLSNFSRKSELVGVETLPLTEVIIKLYDGDHLKAIVESTLEWEGDSR